MKPLLTAILMIAIFAGCKKESTTTQVLDEQVVIDTVATQLTTGDFMNGPHGAVSGKARIFISGDTAQLMLENFMSSNGLDLKVYLSKEMEPLTFVNLGALRSTTGNQVYNIPDGARIEDFKYVLIHCQQYNHLFGWAEIQF